MEPARRHARPPGPPGAAAHPGLEPDADAACHPDPDVDAADDPGPAADPGHEADAHRDPDADTDLEANAYRDSDLDPGLEADAHSDPDADPGHEADAHLDRDANPDLEADAHPDTYLDPGLEANAHRDPDLNPGLQADAHPDPAADPRHEANAHPDPCLDPGFQADADPGLQSDVYPDPDLDPGLEADAHPDPGLDPGLEADAHPDPGLDPGLEADAHPDPGLDPGLEADAHPDPGLDPGLEADAHPDPGLDPGLEADAHPDPGLDPGLEADAHPDPGLDPGLEADAHPDPDVDPAYDPDSDADLGLEADADPDADPDRQTDARPDPDADPRLEADARPDPHPVPGPLLWPAEPERPSPRVPGTRAAELFPGLEGAAGHPGRAPGPSQAQPGPGEPDDGPRLRAVFDALDADGDGFVRTEDFVQFATVYGAEQVKGLTRYLDPSGLGVISFEDFFRGITAIRNGDPEGPPAPEEEPQVCPDEFDDFVTYEATEVTDSAYMGSESTYSECETFTDEDTSTLVHPELHPEGDADSTGGSAVASECLDGVEDPGHGALLLLPGRSLLHSQAVVTVIGGEEHFEDYGEGGEGELSAEALCNGEQACSGPAFLTPSPTKRLSSKKVARHLLQSGALSMEALQAPPSEPEEDLDEDIADKVVFLEKRVSELERDTAANGEQHSRLRQENLQLVHRANALEEQLKEQELRACETVLEEARRQRELLSRMEREKSIEVENLQARLQQLDEENSELRSCTPCLKASIQRLGEEKQKLLDEIEELSLRLSEEQENKRRLGDRLSQERHQFQRDKEATQELIEDLRKQLEHLQLFKLEAEQRRGRSGSSGLQHYNSRTRESELEQEVRRLKQDNRNLKEQNDELNGQIITLSIQGAKNLFSTSFSESLAAEISSVSRDELMEAIQKQEEINLRLQDYIDRIIVAIMETNPSILEVK
ncbi:rab11 family-interacting protein 3 isoform X2 [Sorex araneus]|uniref:rab11 family-interacting protein 3 isoform X2 n=1 Tax=Sorex araneus TaxID=42254 RepID=UPI0024338BBC|nr:rab11 family-interacting protein 3 isoform X2 [Sorex araneus]